jgi:glucosyl-3-phosphoglycerate synthase
VEIAVLIDTARRLGVDAIAQVDLGERGHSHQSDADLAVMAAELMVVTERRRPGVLGGMTELGGSPELVQFTRSGGELRARTRAVPYVERPPARALLSGSLSPDALSPDALSSGALSSGARLLGARVSETEG